MPHITVLPIVVPLLAGALLSAVRPLAGRWFTDLASLAAITASIALCAILLAKAAQQPFAYWLGGWRPNHGVTIGISLSIDPFGIGMGLFCAFLTAAAMVYSIHYFDAVDGLFQVLMLMFCAAMLGFCMTGDLFNLIVFFELMGAVAYALTAQHIEERAPIQGALNFAITNSIAGYAMFIAVGLLYARTGALNMAQIGATLDGHPADPLVIVAMVLLFAGFLTKAAVVPLHFWLADAHAVTSTPVCVLFSGVMIELGVYAVARIYWVIFAGPMHSHVVALRAILVAAGVVTALTGAAMCTLQRHIKRLLAFSSISHIGLLVCGVGLLEPRALAGVAVYVLGHGLTKAALFMCAGVLLHRFATVDEYELHNRGRAIPAAGVMFAAGGLLLAAIPPFATFAGKSLLEETSNTTGYGWLIPVFILVSALTGGAVLRITGRIFLGLGPTEGPDPQQERAAREPEDENQDPRDHTPITMLLTPAVLLLLVCAVALVPGAVPQIEQAAARFADHAAYTTWVLRGLSVHWPLLPASHVSGEDIAYGIISVIGALIVAAIGLFGRPLREAAPQQLTRPWTHAIHALRGLHSGHIGDYITWWTAGTSILGGICLLALR